MVVITKTTISIDEINQVLDKGRKLLADITIAAGYADSYKMQDDSQCIRLLLYLYLYAIESWDTSYNASNFYDQKTLIKLLSQVEQLFYICNTTKPCNT